MTTFSSLNLRAMTDPRTRTYSRGALTPLRGSQALTHRSAPVRGGLRRGSAWLNPPSPPGPHRAGVRGTPLPGAVGGGVGEGREGRRRGEGAPAGGPQRRAAGSGGRSGYRRRPAHLWATSANCARWKSAARRRISSQAAAIAASPLHVSPAGRATGSERGQTSSLRPPSAAPPVGREPPLRRRASPRPSEKKTRKMQKKAVSPRGPDSSSWSPADIAARAKETVVSAVRLSPAQAWAACFARCQREGDFSARARAKSWSFRVFVEI